MRRALADYGLFLREFRRTFHTTGAILPSSPRLGRALARFVAPEAAVSPPRRILEVGPGTGAVTTQIARRLGERDRLDFVELNDQFVARLRERLGENGTLAPVAAQTTIHHAAVQDLVGHGQYDVIVSGLPLNNFSVELVESIVASLRRLLAPGGTLSYFEYIAVRPMRALVSRRDERERLRRLDRVLGSLLRDHEFARNAVVANVPPAWVHHLRFDGAAM